LGILWATEWAKKIHKPKHVLHQLPSLARTTYQFKVTIHFYLHTYI